MISFVLHESGSPCMFKSALFLSAQSHSTSNVLEKVLSGSRKLVDKDSLVPPQNPSPFNSKDGTVD